MKLLTVDQVATMLSLNRMTVLKFIRGNKLTAAKIGHGWRVDEADLTSFVSECKVAKET